MNFKTKKPTLLLVDVQKAFLDKDYPGIKRNNPEAELICCLLYTSPSPRDY